MRPIAVTVGPLAAASTNNIATSQSIAAAGPLTLNGSAASNGVATLDMARRVAVTSAGNDSGITFTITGTDRSGRAQSEILSGANAATAQSALDYLTVTSILTSGATASTVQVGTNGFASSAYARMDEYASAPLGGNVVSVGNATWTLEGSYDDPNLSVGAVPVFAMAWFPLQDSTAAGPLNVPACPLWVRLTQTGGVGSSRATLVQYAELSKLD